MKHCVRLALVAALAFARVARADDPIAQPEEPVLTPAQEQAQIETIEVTGKREEPAIFLDTPVEVEAIPEQRVRDLPAQTLADVASNLAGIRTQQRVQGQGSAASVEGLPAEYTKALVNGQHYAGELGGVADLEDMPTANASKILVLRGPQATRYGSEAAGAVIDIQTMRPPVDDGYRLLLDGAAGSDDNLYGSQVTSVRSGAFGATLATSFERIDGYEERGTDSVFIGPGKDSKTLWQDTYGTFEYSASESLRLFSNVGWRKDETRIDGEDVQSGSLSTPRWITSAGFDAQLDADTELEAELYRYASDMESTIGRDFELRDDEWVVDASVARRFEVFGVEPALRVGVDWRVPSLDLREGALDPSFPPELGVEDVDEDASVTGFYAILETRLSDWASLQLGGREQMHSKFDSKFVPQAALLLEPRSDLRFRFSWGTGYRTPSLRDLYQPAVPNLGGAYFLAGNPDLKTESAVGLRAGFEADPLDDLRVSATFFSNVVDDYIRSANAGSIQIGELPGSPGDPNHPVCAIVPSDPRCLPGEPIPILAPVFRKTNLDKLRTRGVEAQIRYRPHPLLELRGGYGYLTTQVDSSTLIGLDELPNEPRHTVDLDATITLPRLDTIVLTRARWRDGALVERSGTGSASFTSADHSDPSWIVDMRVRQPLRPGLSVFCDLRNLTNTKAVDSYEVRGTTVFVGVSLDLESN